MVCRLHERGSYRWRIFYHAIPACQPVFGRIKEEAYTRVAIFAHGGVLICAQLYAGILKAEEAFDALTPYGGIVRINLDKE